MLGTILILIYCAVAIRMMIFHLFNDFGLDGKSEVELECDEPEVMKRVDRALKIMGALGACFWPLVFLFKPLIFLKGYLLFNKIALMHIGMMYSIAARHLRLM